MLDFSFSILIISIKAYHFDRLFYWHIIGVDVYVYEIQWFVFVFDFRNRFWHRW